MIELTMGLLRKSTGWIPDDAPLFIHDSDGIPVKIASIDVYKGCDGLPAVAIELEEAFINDDGEADDEVEHGGG